MEVHDTVQEAMIETIRRKRNPKSQNGFLKRPYEQLRKEETEGKGEKKVIYILSPPVPLTQADSSHIVQPGLSKSES